mmetsp:Transcript_111739/g.322948  ORF Transcript_111739/g.322948 Transcript_111739/m.322948 type:complete len:226 (+) Transcript_111739:181-858(+)
MQALHDRLQADEAGCAGGQCAHTPGAPVASIGSFEMRRHGRGEPLDAQGQSGGILVERLLAGCVADCRRRVPRRRARRLVHHWRQGVQHRLLGLGDDAAVHRDRRGPHGPAPRCVVGAGGAAVARRRPARRMQDPHGLGPGSIDRLRRGRHHRRCRLCGRGRRHQEILRGDDAGCDPVHPPDPERALVDCVRGTEAAGCDLSSERWQCQRGLLLARFENERRQCH